MSELRDYYVLIEPWAVYVKDAELFVAQGGLKEEWGKRWESVKAESVEHAQSIGVSKPGAAAPSPPKDPRDEALKVAREALGVALNTFRDTGNKYAAEECFEAIRQIKEIMGEK